MLLQFTRSLPIRSCRTFCTHSLSTIRVVLKFSSLVKRQYSHIWCTYMPSLLCESFHESCGFSHLSSSHLTLRTSCHTLCTKIVSPLCGSLIFLEVNWSWEVLCAPLVYLQPEFYYSLVLLQVTLLWEAFATLCALTVCLLCGPLMFIQFTRSYYLSR